MNRLTDSIRQDMLRKDFSWMEHTYQFILLSTGYEYKTEHVFVADIPNAYVAARTELFLPIDDANGVASSQGVEALSVVGGDSITHLALCTANSDGIWDTNDDVDNKVVAIIDDGYDLPFVADGAPVWILPNSIINNAWFTV